MAEVGGKRIIHVPRRFTAHEWGGTETVIREICAEQKREGWLPEIVTSKALDSRGRDAIDEVPIRRYNYCYPFWGLSAEDQMAMDKKGGNLLSVSLAWRLISSSNVHVFHSHALNRMGGMVRTAAKLRRVPYVVSLHGGVFDVPSTEVDDMRAPTVGKFEWGRVFGMLLGSRKVLSDADRVICVGLGEFEKAKQALPHDRVSYLPNGVDPSKFSEGEGSRFRSKHGIAPNERVALCLSRIDGQKNQRVLVEAFAQFQKELDGPARLVLIGPVTSASYAEDLKARIEALGIGSNALIIPGLPNGSPELADAFRACDLFVLPSLHEPFGIVALEAWCAEKPLIASRVGGLKAVVDDDRTGLFFDPNSENAAAELAERMMYLTKNPDRAQGLASAGYLEAKSKYSWASISQQLGEIYAEARQRRGLN